MESRGFPLLLRIPPPVLYAAFFAAGLALNLVLHWSPCWIQTETARAFGGLLLAASGLFGLSSLGLFWLGKTTVVPYGRPARLIAAGPYALSRNPMYVALTALCGGAAIMIGCAWPLVFLPAPVLVMQFVIIPFEERQMREAFGRAWIDYCQKVRRWL